MYPAIPGLKIFQVVEVNIRFVTGLQPGGLSPSSQGEQVGVGYGEGVAEQILTISQLRIYPPIARFQLGPGSVCVLARKPGIQEWNESLVDLRRQKTKPFL
ncbi:hypothetical protein D3C85_1181600 [compost metagenome]